MARYIDVDTLLKAIVGEYGRNSATEMLVIGVLNNLLKADVMEVVRCRECKHCQKVQDEWDNDWYFCLNSANNKSVESTDFCSYGERK